MKIGQVLQKMKVRKQKSCIAFFLGGVGMLKEFKNSMFTPCISDVLEEKTNNMH
jgi:hypothetical protein